MKKTSFVAGIIVGPKIKSFCRLKEQLKIALYPYKIKFIIVRFGYSYETFESLSNEKEIKEFLIAPKKESICRMRNEVQKLVANYMEEDLQSIALILDEDIEVNSLIVNNKNQFVLNSSNLLNELLVEDSKIDAIIGKITGDPPIPKTYVQANQLHDIIIILNNLLKNDPKESYNYPFYQLKDESLFFPELYHDIWCLNKQYHKVIDVTDEYNQTNEIILNKITKGIVSVLNGKSFTRPLIRNPNTNDLIESIYRGGVFIVYNYKLLKEVKNDSLIINEISSRRSDMIMAIKAANKGYSIFCKNLSFHHSREVIQFEDEPTKIISDIIGHSMVKSFNTVCNINQKIEIFKNSLEERQNLTLKNIDIITNNINDLIIILNQMKSLISTTNSIQLIYLLESTIKQIKIIYLLVSKMDKNTIRKKYNDWLQNYYLLHEGHHLISERN